MKEWEEQCNEGVLVSHIDSDTLSFVDILRFVLTFARNHRARGKTLSAMCIEKLDMWRRALVAWIAKVADKTVLALYLNNDLSRDHAPPALRFHNPVKRKYIVTPETKWDLLEDARVNHSSPATVLALRSKLEEFGCHSDSADAWRRKEQAMYAKQTSVCLSVGAGMPIS